MSTFRGNGGPDVQSIEAKLLRQNRHYHLFIIGAMAVLALALLVLTVVERSDTTELRRVADTNAEGLEILKRQTSPERQQQNEQRIQQIIMAVDCNNRDAIEDVITGLEDEGLFAHGSIQVITPECEGIINDEGG